MSLGEAVRYPVDKFVIASALILFFAAAFGVPAGSFRYSAVTSLEVIMIGGVLFIAATVGKFVSGWAARKGIKRFATGSGVTPIGVMGLVSAQAGFAYGVFRSRLFSAITVTVMLATFVAPSFLKIAFAGRHDRASEGGYA